jgi:outer membrane autotransporter protein
VQVNDVTRDARAAFGADSYGTGVRVGYRVTGDRGPLVRPFIEAFYQHLHGVDVSDAPGFRTYGPELDRTSYIARASLNASLGKSASVALGYGGEIGDDYSHHEADLSFSIVW